MAFDGSALVKYLVLISLAVSSQGLRLQLMVASKWEHVERRDIQRRVFGGCRSAIEAEHEAEILFFMGDVPPGDEAVQKASDEQRQYGDVVVVGGPDADPFVQRDITYALDRPSARTYRIAHGTSWLIQHRPKLDFVVYLDDDSFLNVRLLFAYLTHLDLHGLPEAQSESLIMGYIMETQVSYSELHICQYCEPCEPCLRIQGMTQLCSYIGNLSFGGCLMAAKSCYVYGMKANQRPEDCIRAVRDEARFFLDYFGSASVPRWLLGMGFVLGRRIAAFIGRNAKRFKVRGSADLTLGAWFAPLEDVRFIGMNKGLFHDHPEAFSIFSKSCSNQTVLMHRMTPERWEKDVDVEHCALKCFDACC
eukprot:TRINITY_DN36860_c0_g1_i2.p1 TRINITY_DN36860_c0_g1~~TRINITY_DN36860_c0_g1_i2.p1  ORF type:complete len:363 (-),score=53.07 TRINITY_DN36860_c0_g1_i2:458-1546(-)